MEKVKEQVHVCPICDQGHVNQREFMKICQPCFREHEIDLGFMEWLIEDQKVINETLDQHSQKFIDQMTKKEQQLISNYQEHYRKWVRNIRIYILVFAYWMGLLIGQMIWG